MSDKMFTSRSAILTYKTCHYKRLLQYHLEGAGFTGGSYPLDLLIGTIVHRGVQHLMEHCRKDHPDGQFEDGCIDQAVNIARILWREILSTQSLGIHSIEEDRLDWIIAEQECLWEGLIRAFALRRLPQILDEYDILEVEKEEISTTFSEIVQLNGKLDALLLRKHDQKLVIFSLKTASMYADVTARDIQHDMQGVSEWFLVQERLTRLYNYWLEPAIYVDELKDLSEGLKLHFEYCLADDATPKIFAVQYECILKGQRKQDPYNSGIYKQQSFICHPLKLDNMMPNISFSSGSLGVTISPDEYKWKIKSGNPGKGWRKCDIWEEIGIQPWIEMLALGDVQPEEGHPFDKILITPDLIVRDEREINEWLVSTRFQEEEIKKHLSELEYSSHDPEIVQDLIWKYFDKNTQNCHDFYGKDCLFVRHCHEFNSIEELRDAGYLIPRKSHHESERLYQIEKGYIEK